MSAPVPADLDAWPRRYAEILEAHSRQPGDEPLRRAAELGRMLAEAGVSLADISAVHLAQLEELVRGQPAVAADVLQRAAPVAQRFLAAYGAAAEERAQTRRAAPPGPDATAANVTAESPAEAAQPLAEEALRREQELMQLLMDNIPDNVYIKDRESRFTHVNRAIVQFCGCASPAEVIGKWDGDFYARDLVERFRADEQHLFETGEPIIDKVELATLDLSTPRWFSSTKVPVRDASGRVVGLVGISREITAQRQAEEALHKSEQRYRALAESAQDFIFIVNRSDVVEYVNEFAAAQLGLRPEDVIGHPRASFFPPEEARRQGANLERVFQAGQPLVTEARSTFPSGERWIHTSLVPLRQPTGEVTAVLGISRDISDRRRAEDGLRREKDRAQQYLDTAGVMFVALDAQGRVTLVNKKACTILGYGEQDLIGQRWFDRFVPPCDRERTDPAFRQLIVGDIDAAEYFENAILTKTGQERLIAWHNVILRDGAGNAIGTLSSGEDITDRRQAEEEIRRYQEHLEELVAQRTRELEKVNARLQEELAFTKHIVTGVPAIICRIAPQGTTFFINPAGERITGYRADELIGRNWFQVFYPGEEYHQVERLLEAFQQGDVRDHEMVLTTKSGTKRTMSWNSINRMDADGRLVEIIGLGIDITERKQADLALRESEERFRQLAENMSGFFWLYDLATRKVLYVGPGYEQLWGRTRASVYADPDSWLEPIHPDDRAEVMEGWRRQRRGEATEQVYRVSCNDGSVRWIRTRGFPIRDAAGAVQRLAGIEEDVTAQKQAERELRAFKAVSDGAVHGSAIADMQGRVTYVNAAFAAMHGRTVSEVLGQHLSCFHSAAQMQDVNKLNRQLVRHGSVAAQEVWHVRADGHEFPTLMTSTIIRDEQGRPEYMAATAIDITDYKRAEDALRQSESRFRTLAETVPVAIAITCGPRVVYVNSTAAAISGYPREELLQLSSYWDLVHPDFRDLLQARAAARRRGESLPSRYELKVLNKDGAERWIELSAASFEYDGDPATLATGVDITDRKQAEEAVRRHQEELARVGRVSLVGEMASGLAHELAQPLSAILYYARGCTARLNVGSWGASDAIAALGKIATQAERAGEFIRRLKAFIRKAEPHRAVSEINAVVHEAVSFAAPEARHGRIPLELELAADLPRVVVDPIQIEQVILNLVRNGIEAMDRTPADERRLMIKTSAGPNNTVCVSVRDAGRGLTPEIAAQAFDPFFTTKPGGTGLGLSISRSIIEAHEGELWLRPDPYHGSTFGFTLPAAKRTDHDGH